MSAEFGFADNHELTFARIDRDTDALIVVGAILGLIHRGLVFAATDFQIAVQAATPKLWHIKTGDVAAHVVITITTLYGGAVIVLYEAATFSGGGETDGVAVVFQNKKRSSANVPAAAFYKDPAFGATGSIGTGFVTRGIPGGPGDTRRLGHWDLKAGTSYVIEATVPSNGIDVFVEIDDMYEATA